MMRREAISRGSTMASNWKAWCDVCVSGVAAYLHDLHRLAVSMHIVRHCARPDREASKIASFICEMVYTCTDTHNVVVVV